MVKTWKVRFNEVDGVADVLFIKAEIAVVIEVDGVHRLVEADGIQMELQYEIVSIECIDAWCDSNRYYQKGLYTPTVMPLQSNYSSMVKYLEDFGKATNREGLRQDYLATLAEVAKDL